MGKFFNGKVKNDKEKLIKYGAIGGGILLILIVLMLIVANNNGKKAVLTLKESIDVEVNTKFPDKMDFFAEFDNFDESKVSIDFSSADIETVGTYYVTVEAQGIGKEDVAVNVIDTIPPELKLHTLKIESGATYDIEEFVTTCDDNSKTSCIVEYYTESIDQNGNRINYANFNTDGTYQIMIIAKDESGNTSAPETTTLTIGGGSGNSGGSTACNYGDLTLPDNLAYPVAVMVGNNNCALDRNLWDDKNTQSPVNEAYQRDYERLKTQASDAIKTNYPNGARIVAYPNYIAIYNKSMTGLAAYAVYVKVYVVDAGATGNVDDPSNLKIAYYLKSDGTRLYDVNAFNLP